MKHYSKILLILTLIIFIYLVQHYNLIQYLNPEMLKSQIEQFGIWGPLVFIGIYILGTILFVPGTPLTLAGGVLFGPLLGTLYVLIGATIGATAAFEVSRHVGRDYLESKLKNNFKALDSWQQKFCDNSFMAVVFLRLIPLFPFNGLNYALGLMKVKTSTYFWASLVGMLPGTFVYVYLGDSLASLDPKKIAIAILLMALLSIGVYLAKKESKPVCEPKDLEIENKENK